MLKKFLVALLATTLAGAGLVLAGSPAYAATYYYAGGQQEPAAGKTAISANIYVADPAVDSGDHSIMQLSVHGGFSADNFTKAIVETGWTDFNNTGPKYFVSRWVNGTWGGSYTGSGDGWIDATPSVHTDDPGVALTTGSKNFQLIYAASGCNGGAGWFTYLNGAGTGCYPLTLWSAAPTSYTFDSIKMAQAFAEVNDSTGSVPCTDAGTGILATGSGTRANFTAVKYGVSDYANFGTWNVVTNSSYYNTLPVNLSSQGGTGANAFVGGPGAC